ncbi:MAG: hypothetical protein Q4E42_03815 [Phascolarctobacterium sp.]|nr:hypothetical protein [Phascolarctobacterium sp.]
MRQDDAEQKSKRQMALMMVYGLPIVIVMDFVIAFKAGQWLDLYFSSGGNLYRNLCLVLAFVVTLLTFLRLTRFGGGKNAK